MSDPLPVPEEWPEYSVDPQGGDPLTQDLTSPYDKGDLCWILVCTILCWQISTSEAKVTEVASLTFSSTRHWISVCRDAQAEGCADNGLPIAVLRLRLWNSVLDIWLFALSVPCLQPVPGQWLTGWTSQRPGSTLTRQQ